MNTTINATLQKSLTLTTSTTTTTNESSSSTAVQQQSASASSLRSSLNAQIIEASLKIEISASSNSQGLLYRSCLESVYEALSGNFESQINPDYKMPSMMDENNPFATPEGTANVILSFSLGLYAQYSASHSGEDSAETATNFIELVRGGFEKGYNEAVEILDALSVFDGTIKSEIEKTWELVQKGYDDWLASMTNPVSEESAEVADTQIDTQ